jgi:hypothetical protein
VFELNVEGVPSGVAQMRALVSFRFAGREGNSFRHPSTRRPGGKPGSIVPPQEPFSAGKALQLLEKFHPAAPWIPAFGGTTMDNLPIHASTPISSRALAAEVAREACLAGRHAPRYRWRPTLG